MKKTVLALALPIIFASSAHAADVVEPNPLRFMVGIGLTGGGESIATVNYTDGSSSNVSSGSGVQLMMGLDYRINESFSVQGSVGYHGGFTPQASNGDASFDRYPIELLAYYHPDQHWRVGGGVRFVESPKLKASGAASDIGMDFKNTTGAIVEVEYFFTPHTSIKVRGVKESYTPTYGGPSISGSHGGVFGDYYF
ncbi:MAG TPA: outer membrane beta-barrel protein [Burkholderiaceae bacterium]